MMADESDVIGQAGTEPVRATTFPEDGGRDQAPWVRTYWWLVLTIAIVGVLGAWIATTSPSPYPAGLPGTAFEPVQLRNMPPQAAGIVYGPGSGALEYAHPGGMVVAGRDNYRDSAFKKVSAAGGTVLIYLDPVIDNPWGRYHTMLMRQSICGPAIRLWPGSPKANRWGYLSDFRVGSILQRKLPCVLEKMVSENPQMGGWFADDVGSRSWYPGIDWETWGSANRRAYRAGAIELTETFRKVADRHGLVFLVNGTWGAGSLASHGGGYPDMMQAGNALADGGFVENHDGELHYFGPYGCSAQWAAESPVTRGKAFNFAITSTHAGFVEFRNSRCYSFVNEQGDYSSAPAWGRPHRTGLPTRVR
jgi:hypothetical protein